MIVNIHRFFSMGAIALGVGFMGTPAGSTSYPLGQEVNKGRGYTSYRPPIQCSENSQESAQQKTSVSVPTSTSKPFDPFIGYIVYHEQRTQTGFSCSFTRLSREADFTEHL